MLAEITLLFMSILLLAEGNPAGIVALVVGLFSLYMDDREQYFLLLEIHSELVNIRKKLSREITRRKIVERQRRSLTNVEPPELFVSVDSLIEEVGNSKLENFKRWGRNKLRSLQRQG